MNDEVKKSQTADSNAIRAAWIAAGAAVISALIALGSAGFSYLSRDRELNIRLVEIGIGVLRADPEKSGESAARQWAIELIEKNSRVNFTPEDRAALLKKPIDWSYPTLPSGTGTASGGIQTRP